MGLGLFYYPPIMDNPIDKSMVSEMTILGKPYYSLYIPPMVTQSKFLKSHPAFGFGARVVPALPGSGSGVGLWL